MQNFYTIALDSTSITSHNYHVYFSFFLVGKRKALDLFRRGVYGCFTILCWFLLYNKVNQFYVCARFYTSHPHPLIQPVWVTTEPWAELPVLRCRYPPRESTYMSGLYSCPEKSFLCTIFLDSTYYIRYWFFSYFILYESLGLATSLQTSRLVFYKPFYI